MSDERHLGPFGGHPDQRGRRVGRALPLARPGLGAVAGCPALLGQLLLPLSDQPPVEGAGCAAYGEIPSALGLWGEVYYRLHRLVKRWRLQVLQVEQQHLRFIQAIQASPNGVLMLDDADQIEWCNDVAEHHLGLNARRDVRQRITHLIRRPSSSST